LGAAHGLAIDRDYPSTLIGIATVGTDWRP
jgi:hypothetical protein